MTDTFVNIQESVPGFRPADAGSPAEAGAYGMYLFYCWQGLNGNDCSEARRELSGVHASIRALLREMDARRACYDPRELYAWLDWYVLLRRVAGGGPFDETELDALRERYVEGWLSGEAGYRAELAVAQILCWEERGSRLATPRRAGAARQAISEWYGEMSRRPESVDIDSPEILRRLLLLRDTGTVWGPPHGWSAASRAGAAAREGHRHAADRGAGGTPPALAVSGRGVAGAPGTKGLRVRHPAGALPQAGPEPLRAAGLRDAARYPRGRCRGLDGTSGATGTGITDRNGKIMTGWTIAAFIGGGRGPVQIDR